MKIKPTYSIEGNWLKISFNNEVFAIACANIAISNVMWRAHLCDGVYFSEIEKGNIKYARRDWTLNKNDLLDNLDNYRLALKFWKEYKEKYLPLR